MYTYLVLYKTLDLWCRETGAPIEIFTQEIRPRFIRFWEEAYR